MKTFIFENPEVYIVQYKVPAKNIEEAQELFKAGADNVKEMDLWYHADLADAKDESPEPVIYEDSDMFEN